MQSYSLTLGFGLCGRGTRGAELERRDEEVVLACSEHQPA